MRETPYITALMLYYGRRNFAEEAVESFLRQTYPHKRLLIVNTHPDPVWFEQEHPNIEIHNLLPDSFENLNEKYNYGFSQIRTNWWAPWDSDDLWMPWHFENIVNGIPEERWPDPLKVGVTKCYFACYNKICQIGWNMWSNCIYETFDSEGKLHPGCDQTSPINCDNQTLNENNWKRRWLRDSPPSVIFRWDDSGHGSEVVGEKGLAFQAKLREKMNAVRNSKPFRPHWDRDYVADVEEFNKTHDWRKTKRQSTPLEVRRRKQ